MKITNKLLILALYISVSFVAYAEGDKWQVNPTKDENAPFGVYIPGDIYEVHKELDKMLTTQLKQEIKQGSDNDLSQYHFGLGQWLRNNWALWKGSKLSEWFNSKGIFHPDDMSGIIIKSYYRYLRTEPLDLEKEYSYYIRYWRVREKPKEIPCKKGEIIFSLTGRKSEVQMYHHIAYCPAIDTYIVFELESGWTNPDKRMLARIMELKDKKGLISAPLEKPN